MLKVADDDRRFAPLVDALADDDFNHRRRADRRLRAAGPMVLGYLYGLDVSRLEPEQQFRIARIIKVLEGAGVAASPARSETASTGDTCIRSTFAPVRSRWWKTTPPRPASRCAVIRRRILNNLSCED